MDKILAAVDFSESSMNAFRHSLSYAKKMKADLTMVWVDPETFKFMGNTAEKEDNLTRAREAFEGIWKQYRHDLDGGELKYVVKRGQVHEEIVKTAVEEDAELIIAGTHGVSGVREFWMGSNVFRLIMASPMPVISVRGSTPVPSNIDTIILPVDSTIETKQKNEIVAYIAGVFGSKVHVLSLYSSKMEEMRSLVDNHSEEAVNYLKEEGIKIRRSYREGNNITSMTLEYAREEQADLIVIMTEQEIKTANLWMGPYARQMVNHSEVPVLSLKPQELIKSLRE